MKFEDRVAVLCAQALAASDDAEIRTVMQELRLVLHQRVEELRTGLLATYIVTQSSRLKSEPQFAQPLTRKDMPSEEVAVTEQPSRTWRRVVQEISRETDRAKALQLCRELAGLLQRQASVLEGGEA